jgi:hypothetical protein
MANKNLLYTKKEEAMKLKHLKTWNYPLKEAAGWILGTLPASS